MINRLKGRPSETSKTPKHIGSESLNTVPNVITMKTVAKKDPVDEEFDYPVVEEFDYDPSDYARRVRAVLNGSSSSVSGDSTSIGIIASPSKIPALPPVPPVPDDSSFQSQDQYHDPYPFDSLDLENIYRVLNCVKEIKEREHKILSNEDRKERVCKRLSDEIQASHVNVDGTHYQSLKIVCNAMLKALITEKVFPKEFGTVVAKIRTEKSR